MAAFACQNRVVGAVLQTARALGVCRCTACADLVQSLRVTGSRISQRGRDDGRQAGLLGLRIGSQAQATLALLIVTLIAHGVVALAYPLVPSNDSVWYLAYTHAGFVDGIFDPYASGPASATDILYPIGYPLLLDLGLLLLGWKHLALGLILFQHALAVGSTLLMHRLCVRAGHPRAGWLAGLAYALYFPASAYCHMMMSETLFTALALATAYAFLGWMRDPQSRRLLTAGFLLGLSILVRSQGVAFGFVLGGFVCVRRGVRVGVLSFQEARLIR